MKIVCMDNIESLECNNLEVIKRYVEEQREK